MRNSDKKQVTFGPKALVMTASLTLALCAAIGGTVAYLISTTESVTNTFTYGDIDITLTETPTDDGDDDPNTNTYEMVPGNTVTKDPLVTVLADSEDCWLFVELTKSENFDEFMTYGLVDGWEELEENVYYREVSQSDADQGFYVLENNTVTVNSDVTKEMLNSLDENSAYPTLTFKAYAVQRSDELEDIDTAAKAWELAKTDSQ